MTAEVRLGRWQDVLADVTPHTVIVDAPYSERTHVGALGSDDGRTQIDYSHWGASDVEEFVSSWAPRISCWMVSLTDSVLSPLWRESMERNGLYTFPRLGVVISGMGVRMQGDGPSSWTLDLCVARRRAKRLGSGPGIWRSLPGGYFGPATHGGRCADGPMVGRGLGGGRGKPEWLVDALVRDYSDPGMLVCDPCSGWGSTLIAARASGRMAVGAEVDVDAYMIAARRLAGGEARPRSDQPSLFDAIGGAR